jgi:hypothetical protein
MSWIDCQHIDPNSWFGKPPALRPVDVPLSRGKIHYSANFATAFNSTGEVAIRAAISDKSLLSIEPHYVSPFLFFCEGIRPAAISQYFFQNPTEAQTLFYYYFASANLDYMTLTDALRVLLSRVALPDEEESLLEILCAFADAYYESNQYTSKTREEICKLAIASIVLSMSKRKGSSEVLSQARFLTLVEQVHCTDEYKLYLYKSLRKKPIVIYFMSMHFSTDPETVKKGILTKTHGLFNKKKLYCVLSEQIFKIYNDQVCSDQSEEIPLHNVTVKFVPAKDKEPAKMIITSKDGLPFGSSFQKNLRRPAKKSVYEFSGSKDDMELKTWVDNLNFAAFSAHLIQLANPSSKSD